MSMPGEWPQARTVTIDLLNRLPPGLLEAARYIDSRLKEKGFEAFIVGGSIRDLLLGLKIKDIDFATNARPDQVQQVFNHTIPVGIEFGTVIVVFKKIPIEITTYRFDAEYDDGRRPSSVTFGETLQDDVTRRDFTINGLAYDISRRQVFDYVGGFTDLEEKKIKTIGDPLARFKEDGLRPIRGCRFAASLHFNLSVETFNAMQEALGVVTRVAHERFYDEWRKTLKIDRRHLFFDYLFKTGILKIFMPEIAELFSSEVRSHVLRALETAKITNMASYAALLIFYHFRLHEQGAGRLSPEDVKTMKNWLADLKFPVRQARLAVNLCCSPLVLSMLYVKDFAPEELKPALKRALSRVDQGDRGHHLRFLFNLADLHRPATEAEKLKQAVVASLWQVHRQREPVYLSQLAINGNDLARNNITGVAIGKKLQELMALVIEDAEKNSREYLLGIIKSG